MTKQGKNGQFVSVMFNDCYSRTQEFLREPPLPVYLYSVGEKTLSAGEVSEMGALKNSFAEIIWGVEGVGELTLFGETFRIDPGDVFFYLPGEAHRHRALSEKWVTRWICFDGPLAEAYLLSYRYPRHQQNCRVPDDGVFEDFKASIADSDLAQIRRISGILCQILSELCPGRSVPRHSSLLVKQCMELIQSRIADRNLDLNMVCDTLNVNRSTLTRLFKAKVGVSPGRYIRDRRLQAAQILLQGTNLPVGEIAGKCGFPELTSFIRFIRENLGCSPLVYRGKTQKKLRFDIGQNHTIPKKNRRMNL